MADGIEVEQMVESRPKKVNIISFITNEDNIIHSKFLLQYTNILRVG